MSDEIKISMDVDVAPCECNNCGDLNYSDIPNVGESSGAVKPVFVPPTVEVTSQTSLTYSLQSSSFSYQLNFQKNDAGDVTAVRVYANGVLIHTGGLSGTFNRIFSAEEVITYELDHGAGPIGYDSKGGIVENPIVADTIEFAGSVLTVRLPIYGGNAANDGLVPDSFTGPQAANFFLNTGTINRFFWFAVPAGTVIDRIEDENAMYLSLKPLFTILKTVTFLGQSYEVYRMSNAVPYNINHKFNLHVS